MYKVITLMKRRQGLSVEDFQHQWLTRHAGLAAQTPGLRRYVQSHTLAQGYARGERFYDGISEMWFDDAAAWLAASAEPAHAAALAADEATLIDAGRKVVMPVEALVVKDGPIPLDGVKNVEFVNRRPGMALEPFRAYWREVHGPLAAGIALMRRYEQNHLRLDQYAAAKPPRFDGLAITWFDSTGDMKAGTQTEVYAHTRADEANFLPDGHLPFIVTREHVIVA